MDRGQYAHFNEGTVFTREVAQQIQEGCTMRYFSRLILADAKYSLREKNGEHTPPSSECHS